MMDKKERQDKNRGFLVFWRNMKLKNKLLISLNLLIILITISILISINRVITNNMLKNKQKMVESNIAGIENLIQERIDILEKYSTFIINGGYFINAINVALYTEEYEEIKKQSLDIQEKINVERIMTCRPVDAEKCVLMACTTGNRKSGESIPVHPLFKKAEKNDIASQLLFEDGMFAIKVCGIIKKGEDIAAYLVIDDFIGEDLAEHIEASTGAKIALLSNKGQKTGKVITSTHKDLVGKEISGEAFTEMVSRLDTTYQPNFMSEGKVHMAAFKPIFDKNNNLLGSMLILAQMDDVLNMKSNIIKAMTSIGMFAIVLGVAAIIMLLRSIINPIRQLLFTAQAMGRGDLTQKVEISGNNEIGQISQAFNQMQEKLLNLVKQMKISVGLLESSSVELSTSSRQQADGSMQQSTSLTETSTTVEELAITSKQIAENAKVVAHLARQSLAGMENIRNNTDQEANRILTLGEKSQTIGEVVAMIDDIARQTNILALNASIEAERAGEAGKGFAVVAIEIRELATNVAKSTKQIREIIKEIQDATNASVMATENVGKSVAEGIELSKKTADSANQISMATQQQGSASEQVVSAIKQMSEIVGQTTADANQIADTAHQLVELTTDQKGLVEQFTIN
ncbi:MAG: methyl-accepting chemotaxis protein [bacterium]